MNNNEWNHTNEDGQHNRPEYASKRAHILFFVKNYAIKDACYHGNHQVAEMRIIQYQLMILSPRVS